MDNQSSIIVFALLFVAILVFIILYLTGAAARKQKKLAKDQKRKLDLVPKEEIDKIFDSIIDDFVAGKMSNKFSSDLLLKSNEQLLFDIPNVQLCEEKAVKVGGGYGGISVRVMKGVYARYGGFVGGIERKVVPIDSGNFILTNMRLIFSGRSKSLDIPLQKINTIESLGNGLSIARSGKTNKEYFIGTDAVRLSTTIMPEPGDKFEETEIEWKLTGEEVKRMIQKLIQE